MPTPWDEVQRALTMPQIWGPQQPPQAPAPPPPAPIARNVIESGAGIGNTGIQSAYDSNGNPLPSVAFPAIAKQLEAQNLAMAKQAPPAPGGPALPDGSVYDEKKHQQLVANMGQDFADHYKKARFGGMDVESAKAAAWKFANELDLKKAEAGYKQPVVNDFNTFIAAMKEQNPNATQAQISKAWEDRQVRIMGARGAAFVGARPYATVDTETGQPIWVSGTDLTHDRSGRYAPVAPAEKAMTKTALIEDIRGSIQNTRQAVSGLKNDFPEEARLQLYKAVNSTDPSGAINNLIGGEFGKSLKPDQQDYLIQVQQLAEQAMAMRSVLGAGQGSDDVRKAIGATIPSTGAFSKDYAQKQLNAFEMVLNRVNRGVLKVPLRPMQSAGGSPFPPAPGGDSIASGAAAELARRRAAKGGR